MADKNKIKYNLRGIVTGKPSSAIKKIVDSLTPEDMDEAKKELEQEPVNDELEEAAKRYGTEGDEISGLYIIDEEVEAFKAGAKWQKQQDKETIELAEDHAMLAGMEKMKENMMAKAIDAELYSDGMFIPLVGVKDREKVSDIKFGDKVKVIIIKEN